MLPELSINPTGQQLNPQLKRFLYTKDKRDNIDGEGLKNFNLLILIVMNLALLKEKLVGLPLRTVPLSFMSCIIVKNRLDC